MVFCTSRNTCHCSNIRLKWVDDLTFFLPQKKKSVLATFYTTIVATVLSEKCSLLCSLPYTSVTFAYSANTPCKVDLRKLIYVYKVVFGYGFQFHLLNQLLFIKSSTVEWLLFYNRTFTESTLAHQAFCEKVPGIFWKFVRWSTFCCFSGIDNTYVSV